jgi:hypothetical protein
LETKERRSSVGFFDFVMFRAFRGFSIFSRKKAKNRRKNGTMHPFAYPKPSILLFAFSCPSETPASETPSSSTPKRRSAFFPIPLEAAVRK